MRGKERSLSCEGGSDGKLFPYPGEALGPDGQEKKSGIFWEEDALKVLLDDWRRRVQEGAGKPMLRQVLASANDRGGKEKSKDGEEAGRGSTSVSSKKNIATGRLGGRVRSTQPRAG